VRGELNYKTDLTYHILGSEEIGQWDFGGSGREGYPDTSHALRDALNKNPHMKVLFCAGYYDLATPYAAPEHTISQLGLDASLRKNITYKTYEAGHMMYLHGPSLAKLKKDAAGFVEGSSGR
jgi:carboxypeptidase C (cathepsin A)